MPGWWMFPFKQVIDLLQKVKTNGKIGKATIVELHVKLTLCHQARLNAQC